MDKLYKKECDLSGSYSYDYTSDADVVVNGNKVTMTYTKDGTTIIDYYTYHSQCQGVKDHRAPLLPAAFTFKSTECALIIQSNTFEKIWRKKNCNKSALSAYEGFYSGNSLYSENDKYSLTLTVASLLVLQCKRDDKFIDLWHQQGNGSSFFVYQTDGNLVLYKEGGVVWGSDVLDKNPKKFQLHDNGSMTTRNQSDYTYWTNKPYDCPT